MIREFHLASPGFVYNRRLCVCVCLSNRGLLVWLGSSPGTIWVLGLGFGNFSLSRLHHTAGVTREQRIIESMPITGQPACMCMCVCTPIQTTVLYHIKTSSTCPGFFPFSLLVALFHFSFLNIKEPIPFLFLLWQTDGRWKNLFLLVFSRLVSEEEKRDGKIEWIYVKENEKKWDRMPSTLCRKGPKWKAQTRWERL